MANLTLRLQELLLAIRTRSLTEWEAKELEELLLAENKEQAIAELVKSFSNVDNPQSLPQDISASMLEAILSQSSKPAISKSRSIVRRMLPYAAAILLVAGAFFTLTGIRLKKIMLLQVRIFPFQKIFLLETTGQYFNWMTAQ